MATTKISSTKSTSRAINYAEKRAEEKSGLNCDVEYAKGSFKAVRELYNKTNGNEGHVVIQSFKPDEVTPKQCNQLGLELAQKIASNHQVAVYTHADTDHVHNHIVINAVDIETGKKFNNDKKALRDIRNANDQVCREHGLSIPEKQAEIRYTQGEKGRLERGKTSWKDEVREKIEDSLKDTTDFEQFEKKLKTSGVEITRKTKKTITYKHESEDKKVRGSRLGNNYDLGGVMLELERQNERAKEREEQEREREQERRQEQYADKYKVDWDGFENIADERRNQRIEKAKQIARKNDDRNRERPREPQSQFGKIDKKIGRDHDGLQL